MDVQCVHAAYNCNIMYDVIVHDCMHSLYQSSGAGICSILYLYMQIHIILA